MSNLAAVMPELGRIEIRDVPEPSPGPREAVVAIEAVGVCGSDTAYFTRGRIGDWVVDGPLILGHEVSGRVVAVGDAVTRVSVGDRVAIEPGTPCRDCEDCLAGRYHLCSRLAFLATPPYDGALVQRVAFDERNLFVVPSGMSYEEAALCEPLSVGIWACRRADLRPGDRVLVSGAGPVGMLAAQVARALGASSVVVSDVSEFRLAKARELGFEVERSGTVDEGPGHEDADVLLECSGAPGVLAQGLWRLRNGGRAAMVGMPKQDVSLPLSRLNVKEISLALVNRYAHTWPTAISLVSSGRVDVASLVTHRFALEETVDALTLASRVPDSLKAVVYPQGVPVGEPAA
ncbi:NAD(P)-dependent alcohol dehydrogenase [Microbacterium timonense]|uniref:NAD(P)-dependent alcohol dehydrogenase n=1 Tax=Microbacterium timonense TaxID=2086576 RepID=UPI000D102A6B|nr:NAD(P)-dependent alcohol dehydrogenase [Microbacterium timonense]